MRSFLLLACAAGALTAELKVPMMPRKVATLPRESLKRYLSELGHESAKCRDNGSCYVVVKDGTTDKLMDMSWSDQDTLLIRSAWNSPHTDLGDYPIVNTWNSKYRFCKCSIQDSVSSEEPGETVIIMHLDQFLPVGFGDEAIKDILKRSLDIYQSSMLAFDRFIVDVYNQAAEKQKSA
ncbi:hypothetical protein DIPPA_27788 [Diplonema papillatum]|nr:hypothetical protein DIPPA_27788 [Diplonema papillatum]